MVWIESHADMEQVKRQWSGKLQGKTILIGSAPKQNMLFDALSKRLTEEQIKEAEKSILPAPNNPLGYSAGNMDLIADAIAFENYVRKYDAFFAFLKAEGALGMLGTTPFYPGIIHPSGTYNFKEKDVKPLPYFAISPENFGKLKRLVDKEISPKIKFDLDSKLYLKPENNVNIIGEITGSDPKLKDEVVMIGAHFDSWHSASGATDNGAGSAVMMEVMRILKTSGLKPKRTIRIALWGGEEQGYLGSLAYAENHYGKVKETTRKKEVERISAYINMDNGAGQMRGIFLQGNEAEGHRYADGNPYIGPDAILNGVFARLGADHEYFKVIDIELNEMSNNKVLATLRYDAKNKETGKAYNAQAAHLWTLKDGKVIAFQQYVDTKKLADAEKK